MPSQTIWRFGICMLCQSIKRCRAAQGFRFSVGWKLALPVSIESNTSPVHAIHVPLHTFWTPVWMQRTVNLKYNWRIVQNMSGMLCAGLQKWIVWLVELTILPTKCFWAKRKGNVFVVSRLDLEVLKHCNHSCIHVQAQHGHLDKNPGRQLVVWEALRPFSKRSVTQIAVGARHCAGWMKQHPIPYNWHHN